MLVVGKQASPFSILHGIAHCVKNEKRIIVCSNRYQRLACCNVARTYFRSSLRIFFTVFLETKTLEINVSHFGVLHWQQWQPPASALDRNVLKFRRIFQKCFNWFQIRVFIKDDNSVTLVCLLNNKVVLIFQFAHWFKFILALVGSQAVVFVKSWIRCKRCIL